MLEAPICESCITHKSNRRPSNLSGDVLPTEAAHEADGVFLLRRPALGGHRRFFGHWIVGDLDEAVPWLAVYILR